MAVVKKNLGRLTREYSPTFGTIFPITVAGLYLKAEQEQQHD